ncbi:hypothetical protein PUN28_004232 [Cardiocondyla obscurior]|uniref:Uncharacterized protein n=1 Tax=Cardiocondyla obscurior TaxID=286306 RepID=A0AAW2GQ67_9HYME
MHAWSSSASHAPTFHVDPTITAKSSYLNRRVFAAAYCLPRFPGGQNQAVRNTKTRRENSRGARDKTGEREGEREMHMCTRWRKSESLERRVDPPPRVYDFWLFGIYFEIVKIAR